MKIRTSFVPEMHPPGHGRQSAESKRRARGRREVHGVSVGAIGGGVTGGGLQRKAGFVLCMKGHGDEFWRQPVVRRRHTRYAKFARWGLTSFHSKRKAGPRYVT